MSLTREQATPLIALVITLTVAHGLKLHLNNNFSLDNFNKDWMISAGGLLAGNIINMFTTSKILDKVAEDTRFVKDGNRNSLGFILMKDIIKLLDKEDRKKINIVGQEFQKADYIYSNFMSEVDKNINDKYKIPSNFTKISKFVLDNITVYEVFKKNKL